MTCRLCKILSVLLCIAVLILAGTAAFAERLMLGDADTDGEVTINDVICIQRVVSGLRISGDFSEWAADINGNGEVEIIDATFIQRWLAHMETPYPMIGVPPTEAPTQAPTEAPTQLSTDADGWGHQIYRP